MHGTEESDWHQTTRLLKGFVTESRSDNTTISKQNIGSFLVFPITGSAIFVLLVVTFVYREYYWRKHGVDTCFCYGCMNRRQTHQENDRAFVEEPQQREHEEERGAADRVVNTNEVRMWYECAIEAFTTVSDRK